jgi:hypothetical protein
LGGNGGNVVRLQGSKVYMSTVHGPQTTAVLF